MPCIMLYTSAVIGAMVMNSAHSKEICIHTYTHPSHLKLFNVYKIIYSCNCSSSSAVTSIGMVI